MYITLTHGTDFGVNITRETYVLILNKISADKQATYGSSSSIEDLCLDFKQSKYDPCIYQEGTVVVGIYSNDCLIIAPLEAKVMKLYVKRYRESLL